ncbi:inorganic triphosphatase YgiF [Sulfuritortus calidifontis]|uniref:Inorganic triphosphatase YgiF n=1 Tax=Sulfuritortus calidifontis TaxID=1914471 RepID=A0A4R3JTY2_9PROT|nr:CYTH and CHAD domain-containing protein [Sulfuritortus calidifontis]TCS69236.1 inorganic triphosphatase YgiF [Sulfuritortus calidifontis]
MADEIELKLAVTAAEALRLKRSPMLAGVRPVRRLLYSIYYDTPEFDLLGQGVALRVRRVGRRWIQTVKAEAQSVGALTTRPEWEVQVASGQPDIARLPEPARAYFPAEVVAALKPCFSTRFERTAWLLEEAGNSLELALDRGEIEAGRSRLPIAEVEFELRAGSPDCLFEVAGRLAKTVAFGLEPRSKAERGYALAGAFKPMPVKAKAPVLGRDDDPGRAWQAMAAAALAQFSANVPGLLSDDEPEFVHQARVAIRRLLAVSGMAKTLDLPRPRWRSDLRQLLAALAPAREWDVLVTELLPELKSMAAAQGEALRVRAVRLQERARAEAREAVRSPDCVRLVLAIGRDLSAPVEAKGKIRSWARTLLDRRLRRLKRLGRDFEALDAKGRHRVRIAAKKLRYTADALAPVYGAAAVPYLDQLSALQDKLGAANDAVMAMQLIDELGLKGEQGAAVREVFERALQVRTQAHARGLGTSWHDFVETPPFWHKAAKQRARR